MFKKLVCRLRGHRLVNRDNQSEITDKMMSLDRYGGSDAEKLHVLFHSAEYWKECQRCGFSSKA